MAEEISLSEILYYRLNDISLDCVHVFILFPSIAYACFIVDLWAVR
jgi:hypothetical protein